MKRSSLALLLACALSAPCAFAQNEMSDAVPMAPKSAATVDALVWRFQPPVGSHWQMRTFSRSHMVQSLPAIEKDPAQKMDISMIQSFTADYDVLSRDQFGATSIRVTYRDWKTNAIVKSNGKTMKGPQADALNRARSLNGAHYTVKQAPNGAIWGVTGMRAFQRRLLQASGITDPVAIEEALKMSDSLISDKSLKALSLMAGKLPAYPVRVSESWTYMTELPAGLPLQLKVEGTRTLKSLTPKIAMIEDKATYNGGSMKMNIPTLPGSPQSGKISVDLSDMRGTISGITRLERESGVPLETTLNQNIGGAFTIQTFDKTGKIKASIRVPQSAQVSTRVVLEPR